MKVFVSFHEVSTRICSCNRNPLLPHHILQVNNVISYWFVTVRPSYFSYFHDKEKITAPDCALARIQYKAGELASILVMELSALNRPEVSSYSYGLRTKREGGTDERNKWIEGKGLSGWVIHVHQLWSVTSDNHVHPQTVHSSCTLQLKWLDCGDLENIRWTPKSMRMAHLHAHTENCKSA